MKLLRWCLLNGLFMGLLILGVAGFKPAMLIFGFWVVVLFAIMVVSALTVPARDLKPIPVTVPRWLDIGYDVVMCSILAGAGNLLLAMMYLVTMLCQAVLIERANRNK